MNRVLFFANKKLPAQDYRVDYALHTRWIDVSLGMPARTEGLPENKFMRADFEEGVSFSDLPAFVRLFARLVRERRTIAATHFFSTKLILLGPILSRAAGIPTLITITGFGRLFVEDQPFYPVLRRVYLLLLNRALGCCRAVLFQNRGDQAFLAARFPRRAGRFRYIGSAVDAEPFFRDQVEPERLTVLLVSRLHPSKGIRDFLEVAEQGRPGGPQFVLIGPPSRGSENLLARIEALAAQNTIDFRGEQHGDDLRAAYRKADVLFFPSYGEGMPRVMIEAGLMGLCPIAYDIRANRDLIPDSEHGCLVPLKDTASVVRLIEQLDHDRAALRHKAKAFQRHILQNYSVAGYRERMDACLKEIVE